MKIIEYIILLQNNKTIFSNTSNKLALKIFKYLISIVKILFTEINLEIAIIIQDIKVAIDAPIIPKLGINSKFKRILNIAPIKVVIVALIFFL